MLTQLLNDKVSATINLLQGLHGTANKATQLDLGTKNSTRFMLQPLY